MPMALEAFFTELLELTTDAADPLIDLLAVTGSGARGKYQHSWSDLDAFVIADPDRTQGLHRVSPTALCAGCAVRLSSPLSLRTPGSRP